jgi:hypothetical protein
VIITSIETTYKEAGYFTGLVRLFPTCTEAAPELTWQRTLAEARCAIEDSIEEHPRYEIVVSKDGAPVGCAVAVVDHDDLHVGTCLAVQWRFMLPGNERLGVALHYKLIQLARALQLNVLAYTHREGLGKYSLRYIRVNKKWQRK